jgi:hypothetical protein
MDGGGSRGKMRRMRAKSQVPVVVGMVVGRDLGRELARRALVWWRSVLEQPCALSQLKPRR